jgi:hypothetical protein
MATKKRVNIESYAHWRRGLVGGVIATLIYTVLAYIFVSLAIDSGSFWQYLLTIVSLGLAIQSAIHVIKNNTNVRSK